MNIDRIPFEITALLGSTEIPMNTYLGLEVGDIVVLEQSTEKSLTLRVGEKECYLATAGLVETHKAVRIDERLHP